MSKPVAHYSMFHRAGDWVIVSGQLGLKDGTLEPDVESQARQALVNLKSVLESAGATIDHVAKCTVFMTDIDDFAVINGIYAEAFGDHRPSRSAVAVAALPLGGSVEIEAWAWLG